MHPEAAPVSPADRDALAARQDFGRHAPGAVIAAARAARGGLTPSDERTAVPSTRCWICGSPETALWKRASLARPLTADDLRITDSRYGVTLGLHRCRPCGFIFAVGRELERLPALYEQLADPGYIESREARAAQMRGLVGTLLASHPQARTLLDVGAGIGLLVAEAQRAGLDAIGIEPSAALVAHAPHEGHDLLLGRLPHPALHGRTFDVITIVDVIEHVTDPVHLLRECATLLAPGGIVVVVTPDVASLAARLMGQRWWHFRLAHVGYFTHASLREAAARADLAASDGFRPQWFFRIRYVAERLARYLPMRRLNRVARRSARLRRLYDRVIPLNIHDSVGLVLRRRADHR